LSRTTVSSTVAKLSKGGWNIFKSIKIKNCHRKQFVNIIQIFHELLQLRKYFWNMDSECSRIFFYSNFPMESNDSKLTFPQKKMTFPDQRIKNSSLYLWINRCMIYWNQWHIIMYSTFIGSKQHNFQNVYLSSGSSSLFIFFKFLCVFYVRQAIKTAARDLVLHGIISQSNQPSIINGVCFYDCCSNINCCLSRSKKASNINFTWILTDFP
jgi:hypothetical protein